MVPPQVRFSWKRQKDNGPAEELPPADGEQLQFEESGRAVSIVEVDRVALDTYKYRCSVKHEFGTVRAQTEQGREGSVGADPCGLSDELSPSPADFGPDWPRHRQLCVTYVLLTAKGLAFGCGVALLRRFGSGTGHD
ncbi:hypothetical protein Q5P01_022945 [Channa striata]|uniref:Ig-like domain-containing protein n=1 Tax=Channa striata TaxID=64152 RepID=A0AA88S7J8_CHASR|nr:hypothetical protein Q5P01_022945 [Channa striata]